MRVLLVKLSSLGDVVHTFPALTDAMRAHPGIEVDWAVEPAFAALAGRHPAVRRTIPVGFRKIRKGSRSLTRLARHLRELWREFRTQDYDLVIDSQGLYKSAAVARLAGVRIAGYDRANAREPLASLTYHSRFAVARDQHAVERTRQLFAAALGHEVSPELGESGLDGGEWRQSASQLCQRHGLPENYVLFLHGSAWPTKQWPEANWRALAQGLAGDGHHVLLPWGSEAEHASAMRIADALELRVSVLPHLEIAEAAAIIAGARAVVGVDSGLAHIAAAFEVPGLVLYGPTAPERTGPYGPSLKIVRSLHDEAPCYRRRCDAEASGRCCMAAISVETVQQELLECLASCERNLASAINKETDT